MLAGSIGQVGSHYGLGLERDELFTGDSLASVQTEVDDKNHVLGGLGQLSTEMRESWANRSPPFRNTISRSNR